MKVIFSKKELLSVLESAAGLPLTKNTYLSCDGLLFECPPDKRCGEHCRISAFDLDMGLRTVLPCTVLESGACVIPMQTILPIVRSLPDGEIHLETSPNGSAVISSGKIHFRISVSSGENFPTMPVLSGSTSYKIPPHLLRRLLRETVFAASRTDAARMGFHGCLFRFRGPELTAAGCDNHRLALSCVNVSAEPESSEENRLLIPGKFLRELLHLPDDSEEDAEIILGRKHVIFKFSELCFFTRILETEYPDYEKMLPEFFSTQAYLSRTEFLEAIERASIIAEAKTGGSGGAYIKLEFSDNAVRISSVSSSGAIDETLAADMSGADLVIGFECRNLLETLKAIPKECTRLCLRMNSPFMGICIESAQGSPFCHALPDPIIYGENIFTEKEKTPLSEEKKRFMYFVLPTRMNIPAK